VQGGLLMLATLILWGSGLKRRAMA